MFKKILIYLEAAYLALVGEKEMTLLLESETGYTQRLVLDRKVYTQVKLAELNLTEFEQELFYTWLICLQESGLHINCSDVLEASDPIFLRSLEFAEEISE